MHRNYVQNTVVKLYFLQQSRLLNLNQFNSVNTHWVLFMRKCSSRDHTELEWPLTSRNLTVSRAVVTCTVTRDRVWLFKYWLEKFSASDALDTFQVFDSCFESLVTILDRADIEHFHHAEGSAGHCCSTGRGKRSSCSGIPLLWLCGWSVAYS